MSIRETSSGASSSSSLLADSDEKEQFIQNLGGTQGMQMLLQQQQQQQKGGDLSNMIPNPCLLDMLNGSGEMLKQLAAQFAQNKSNENDADNARESSPSPPPAVSLNSTMVLPTTSTSTGCSAASTTSSVDSAAFSVIVNGHVAPQTSAVDDEEPAAKKVKVAEEDTPATPTSTNAQLMQFIQQMGLGSLQQSQKQMKESQKMMGLEQFFPQSLSLPMIFPSALHQQFPGMQDFDLMSALSTPNTGSGEKRQYSSHYKRNCHKRNTEVCNKTQIEALKMLAEIIDNKLSPDITYHAIDNIDIFFVKILNLSLNCSRTKGVVSWVSFSARKFRINNAEVVAFVWGLNRRSNVWLPVSAMRKAISKAIRENKLEPDESDLEILTILNYDNIVSSIINERDGELTFRCDTCRAMFQTGNQLRQHRQDVHGVLPLSAPRNNPNKPSVPSTPNGNSISEPNSASLSDEKMCQYCDKRFSNTLMSLHLVQEHMPQMAQGNNPNELSHIMSILNQTTRNQAKSEEKDLSSPLLDCSECSYKTRDAKNLELHLERHYKMSEAKGRGDDKKGVPLKLTTEAALQMVVQNQNHFDGDSSAAALNLTFKNDGVKKGIDEEKVAGNQNHERNSHTSGRISPSGSIGETFTNSKNNGECPFPKQTFLIRCNDGSGEFLTEFLADLPVRSMIDGPRKIVFDLHPAPAAN